MRAWLASHDEADWRASAAGWLLFWAQTQSRVRTQSKASRPDSPDSNCHRPGTQLQVTGLSKNFRLCHSRIVSLRCGQARERMGTRMDFDCDALVIGAGPAGTSAAIL